MLVDAASYFAQLEQALARAERSILIVGWDFDGRIRLCPSRDDCPPLGEVLRALVESRPELEIRILVWSVAVLHAPGAPMPLLLGSAWENHPRISLRLGRHHPIYAAHHQKIVCIDDSLAFVGGIDLTVRRWDTCEHAAEADSRVDPERAPYAPVHDLQMMVDGEAACAVGEVARERWSRAIGEAARPPGSSRDLWPLDLLPDFADATIAIARTAPEYGNAPALHEAATSTDDALAMARRTIYLEAQYLTDPRVGALLQRHLANPAGPEIVIVMAGNSHGLMERIVMGGNRDRLVRRLRRSDKYNRLRAFIPVVPGKEAACEVLVHAKLMIVDDRFLRIGSVNLNRRSRGLDTECDLALEADDAKAEATIAGVRARLLGEHLDVDPTEWMSTMAAEGSLIGAIDRLNRRPRGLHQIRDPRPDGPTQAIPFTWVFDPPRPFEPLWWRRRKRPPSPRGRIGSLPGSPT